MIMVVQMYRVKMILRNFYSKLFDRLQNKDEKLTLERELSQGLRDLETQRRKTRKTTRVIKRGDFGNNKR